MESKDLLNEWEHLPQIELSDDWQNQVIQRTKTAQRKKKVRTNVVFSTALLLLVVVNAVYITQSFSKKTDTQSNRQQALAALSNNFFINSTSNY